MFKHTSSLALLSFALLASRAGAGEAFISSCGTVITQPGTYHIANDLTCVSDRYAIEIEASNVELHFDGHTLTGGGIGTSGSGVGVGTASASISNVRIMGNGTVTGFGSAGIIVGNIGSFIFNVRIVNITASNSGVGIQLHQTIDSALESNTANGNGNNGIELDALSNSAIIQSNQTDGNGNYGIKIARDSTDSMLRANKAHGNLTLDFFDDAAGGSPSCLNTWKGNQFSRAFPSCVQ
jgi:parallel beta-helix repeat protein